MSYQAEVFQSDNLILRSNNRRFCPIFFSKVMHSLQKGDLAQNPSTTVSVHLFGRLRYFSYIVAPHRVGSWDLSSFVLGMARNGFYGQIIVICSDESVEAVCDVSINSLEFSSWFLVVVFGLGLWVI